MSARPVRGDAGAVAAGFRSPQPAWLPPMLATLAEPRDLGPGWVYEPKLDGVRCLAVVGARGVTLYSRNRLPQNDAYPELVEALAARARGHSILDGEVVAVDPATGLPSFGRLQQRMQLRDAGRARGSGVAVQYWLFDCPWYEGIDLRPLPLRARKQVLGEAVRFGGPLVATPVWPGGFEVRYRTLCDRGGEGLIGKRLESPYVGARSKDWLKLKCVVTRPFLVVGWTDPKGSREAFGALLVGRFDDAGRLRYAGKVGTGFDRRALARLSRELARRARPTPPFAGPVPSALRGAHWVEPTLAVDVGFSEWTEAGLLRHPRFVGLAGGAA
jgi:bifunctional non-homologous end joining protein LigD